jgi:predicted RND superfamily exporter protein
VAGGFSVLMLSTFRVTSFMGALTALTIVCALIADFLLLPAILLILDKRGMGVEKEDTAEEAA